MASINQRQGKLFFDFRWRGKRFREYTDLPDTPANRRRAEAALGQLEKAIKRGTFVYGDYFPSSPQAQLDTVHASALISPTLPPAPAAPVASAAQITTPLFRDFAETWFGEMQPQWRRSYRDNLRITLDAHLLPTFGRLSLQEITKSDILTFRARLTEPSDKRPRGLSASRVNHVLCLLKMIVDEAAERFGFITPYRGIKPLRIPRTEVKPFTFDEIRRILETVREDFRPYYTVRFFTGMRTAEIDGLQWRYVDFERGQIVIAQTWVNGRVEDTKTTGSYRTLNISPRVLAALEEQQQRTGQFDFVFCNDQGQPLRHRNVTQRVWYPLLRSLGLEKRRPYQTRHTAATLWLAAGENPEWIARQLGHSAQMLFDTYARYVPNLTRQDGSAFEALLEKAMTANPPRKP